MLMRNNNKSIISASYNIFSTTYATRSFAYFDDLKLIETYKLECLLNLLDSLESKLE